MVPGVLTWEGGNTVMFLYEGLQEEEPVMGADVLC